MDDDFYAEQVAAQIAQYAAKSDDMHALPSIYTYWNETFLWPMITGIYGVKDVYEFFYRPMLDAAARHPGTIQILSVGSGDGLFEIEIAKRAKDAGLKDFRFVLTELSPVLCERAEVAISEAGLSEHFEVLVSDLNKDALAGLYDVVMVNHALHHIVELEHLFDQIKAVMKDDAVFVINDMIGRNGHMRWPETLDVLEYFWERLPIEKKINHALKRVEIKYVNHDCSTEGFEGIRAQDILPELNKRFGFSHFLASGGFYDPIIDRGFGHNYSDKNPGDRELINRMEALNQTLIGSGITKPTLMMGYAVKGRPETRQFKNWSPEFCIRPS